MSLSIRRIWMYWRYWQH